MNLILNKKKIKKKRLGRGMGSKLGKTCGKGHKGQKSRSGGFNKLGFEGGQTPFYKRLPKIGFKSLYKKYRYNINLNNLKKLQYNIVNILVLKKIGLISRNIKFVRIIKKGYINKSIKISNLYITKGVKKIIN